MDLFISPPSIELEKTAAAEVKLPEDPNQWPTEILQECYKQIPYISDFDPRIVMNRVDGERGFGFGHIDVRSKSEASITNPQAQQQAEIRSARIPIVIREGKLCPLDLIVLSDSSKFLPLTENRLRQAIFRPQAFDIASKTPGDQSLISQLYPPYRSGFGYGGSADSMGKIGAAQGATEPKQKKEVLEAIASKYPELLRTAQTKTASLLLSILPTIDAADFAKFASSLQNDRALAFAYGQNGATRSALAKLAAYVPADPDALVQQTAQRIPPTVMQITKVAGGYAVKTASHKMWAPRVELIDRGTLVKRAGVKVALQADTQASVTAVQEAEREEDCPDGPRPEQIKDFGLWKVRTIEGEDLVGFVFPTLLDLDGQPVPTALFTNGSQAALQADLAGTHVGEGANLFEGQPSGEGIFYTIIDSGKAVGTIPLTVHAALGEHDVEYLAETFDGEKCHLLLQPNVKIPTKVDEETCVIPADWKWLPLGQAKQVSLAETAEGMGKQAALRNELCDITIRACGPDSFSLSGFPIEKLAAADREFIDYSDAVFLLGGFGVAPRYAQEKLACAVTFQEPVLCPIGHPITTAAEVATQLGAKTAGLLAQLPNLRRSLVKEAAFVTDPMAVDTVLSLGFINPENMGTFVEALPLIDSAQQKMCELLLAARLGLPDISATALERAVKATEEVYEGLKVLAFQRS